MNSKNNLTLFLIIFLGVLTISIYSLEIFLLTKSIGFIQVLQSVPDEIWFYKTATDYSVRSGMIYAYGTPFWWLSHFLIKIFPFKFTAQIIVLRITFLTCKYLSFLFLTLALWRLRNGITATFFYLTLLLTPAFYFYGKVFSPEYLSIFFTSLSIWFLVKDNREIKINFSLSLFFCMLGVFTKLTLLPFSLLPVLYLVICRKKLTTNTFSSISLAFALSISIGFSCLLTSDAITNTLRWFQINKPIVSPSLNLLHYWLFFNFKTWDQIPLGGLAVDFMPIFIISLLLIPHLFWLIIEKPRKFVRDNITGYCVLVVGIIMIFSVLVVKSSLFWYLFAGYLCSLFGLFSCVKFFSKKSGILWITLILALIIYVSQSIFTSNLERIVWRIKDKILINKMLNTNSFLGKEITDFISSENSKDSILLADVLVPIRSTKKVKAVCLRNFDTFSHFDYLVLNEEISHFPSDPICIEEKNKYIFLKKFNRLYLYINKNYK